VRDELAQILVAAADNERKSAAQFKRFATRYPPLVVMAEKAIWEEGKIEFGLLLLRYIASPTAHAALRRFAGSQAGSEEDRMSALLALQLSGGATPGEKFRLWLGGEWNEIELRNLTIILRRDPPFHNAKARKLVEQSSAAVSERRWADVVTLMRQLIDLEPRAYEALNNLAAALDKLGDAEGSRAALEQALAIRPQYLHARVNLAIKTADQDAEAAAAYLEPLQKQTEFTTEEFALYQYGLARVAFVRGEYSAARSILHMGLSVDPDYEPALDLLEDIDAREFAQGIGNGSKKS
jgi:tetratricopeptide (TPR) repeat protein